MSVYYDKYTKNCEAYTSFSKIQLHKITRNFNCIKLQMCTLLISQIHGNLRIQI